VEAVPDSGADFTISLVETGEGGRRWRRRQPTRCWSAGRQTFTGRCQPALNTRGALAPGRWPTPTTDRPAREAGGGGLAAGRAGGAAAGPSVLGWGNGGEACAKAAICR